jgi:hypothetical protein
LRYKVAAQATNDFSVGMVWIHLIRMALNDFEERKSAQELLQLIEDAFALG